MHMAEMHLAHERLRATTRRHFLQTCSLGVGSMALASLCAEQTLGAALDSTGGHDDLASKVRTVAPRAKQVIYLHMAGGPSQLDLFDYKPELSKRDGQLCPEAFLRNERFAFIKGRPKLLGPVHPFAQHGSNGAWFSSLVPRLAAIADDLTMVRSMTTEQFNHAPAQLLMHTGSQLFGHPSMGSWITYGLGSLNRDLPAFVVLVSGGNSPDAGKSIWGSGYLPGIYQGMQCRESGDPILFVADPPGMDRATRRQSLDALADLNRLQAEQFGSPETLARIEQYELAFRMQVSVPEVMNISRETPATLAMYGAKPGEASFANNCLLARRMVEQRVRFVQLFDWGWDGHGTGVNDDLVHQLPKKCQQVDQPVAALIADLKQRGLLDETLVVWGGEFGRTSMMEARNGSTFLGRDHHPRAFTMLFAGGGLKPGYVHGETDEFGYLVTRDEVTVRDLQCTILHLMGLDAHRLTYPYLGLEQRLIGPQEGPRAVTELL